MPRRTLLLLTAALLAATITGCADGTTSSQGTAHGAGSGTGRHVSDDPEQTLHLAEQLLIKKCMEKRGYEYWVEERPAADGASRFPYVVDDPAWAARHGYGTDLYRERQQEALRDPNQRYYRSMPAGRAPSWSVPSTDPRRKDFPPAFRTASRSRTATGAASPRRSGRCTRTCRPGSGPPVSPTASVVCA